MIRPVILFMILTCWAFADTLTLDTSPLETSGTGPFTIDFQLIQGDGAVTNTFTLSDFSSPGGSINDTPTFTFGAGVAVGTSPLSVTLTNSDFVEEVQFAFTPGSSLSFDVASTSNVEPTTPDTLTFAIFDGSGNEIPTMNPNDSFLEIDLPTDGSGTNAILSGSVEYTANIAAPTLQPASGTPVPEPSTLLVIGAAGAVLAVLGLKRKKYS